MIMLKDSLNWSHVIAYSSWGTPWLGGAKEKAPRFLLGLFITAGTGEIRTRDQRV